MATASEVASRVSTLVGGVWRAPIPDMHTCQRIRRRGLLASAAPFLLRPTAAGAANNTASGQAAVTFVAYDGKTVTCTAIDDAAHNTDDPNQPLAYAQAFTSASGLECDPVTYMITVTYTDKDGVTRTATSQGENTASLSVQGAYSAVHTSVNAFYNSCDPTMSATCSVTAYANPK